MIMTGTPPWSLSSSIENIRFAMLTSHASHGFLNSRPLMTQKMASDGALWFFNLRNSPTCVDIAVNPQVVLTYSNLAPPCYITVSGRAELVVDRTHILSRWSHDHALGFPLGMSDPNLILIRIVIERAVSWKDAVDGRGHYLPCAHATGDLNALGWEESSHSYANTVSM